MVISAGISNASIRTVSLRFRRMEYSTRSFASFSNRSSCIAAYHSTSRARCNSVGSRRKIVERMKIVLIVLVLLLVLDLGISINEDDDEYENDCVAPEDA